MEERSESRLEVDGADTAPEGETPKRPKATPIFCPDPGERSCIAVVTVDGFGHVKEVIEAASPEAASHWDLNCWHGLRYAP
jgi:hypothetical protein